MKERSINFTGWMINAILSGWKTQTRRVIKPQPEPGDLVGYSFFSGKAAIEMRNYSLDQSRIVKCPYGQPGDRLWVRETFSYITLAENEFSSSKWDHKRKPDGYPVLMLYKADYDKEGWQLPSNWSPSIYMPRWASRILLEIIDIKVERLQNITREDVIEEGIPKFMFARGVLSEKPPGYRWKFIEIWDKINARRGFSWESNPWVWVIEFKKQEGER